MIEFLQGGGAAGDGSALVSGADDFSRVDLSFSANAHVIGMSGTIAGESWGRTDFLLVEEIFCPLAVALCAICTDATLDAALTRTGCK